MSVKSIVMKKKIVTKTYYLNFEKTTNFHKVMATLGYNVYFHYECFKKKYSYSCKLQHIIIPEDIHCPASLTGNTPCIFPMSVV